MKIGDKVRTCRISKGMTQEELAFKVGYNGKSMICRIETGKNNPSYDILVRIAAALGVPTSSLLDDAASILELTAADNGMDGVYDLLQSEKRDRQETDEKKAKFEKIFSTQTTSARVELSSREHRLVAAYLNAPDNIKTGVDAILEPFAEKTDVSVG